MRKMTLKNMTAAVNGTLFNDSGSEKEVSGVVIDSRKIEDNFVFVAIKGVRSDGHDYIQDVYRAGAACVICERRPESTDKPYILVASCEQALKDLAEFYRKSLDITVVGITGSVGKTSTKEFVAAVLSQKYRVLKTAGNFNNEIGLPLTIFNIREEHEVAVLEMGISDFGEMHRLSKIARPDICIITNIGTCHLENLGTREGILRAKTEIFDFAAKDYTAILNGDDDLLRTVDTGKNRRIFYGREDFCEVTAKNIRTNGIKGTSCEVVSQGEAIPAEISIPGEHMVYNAMAAACAGKCLGLTAEEISRGIARLENIGGRLNIIEGGDFTIIDDCYNANPVSVKSSVDVLCCANTPKTAILGDMLELGKDELALHAEVGEYCAKKNLDMLIAIGTLSRALYEAAKDKIKSFYFEDIESFIGYEEKNHLLIKGGTVLVKASHSMHFERIVEHLG